MKTTTFNTITTLLLPLMAAVVLFFLAGSADALCCRLPGIAACENYNVSSCDPYVTCSGCPQAQVDGVVKSNSVGELFKMERAEALQDVRKVKSALEDRKTDHALRGASVNEALQEREAKYIVSKGHDNNLLPRVDPYKPKPKPTHQSRCCNTACDIFGCTKCALVNDKPCNHGSCAPQACAHGLTMEDISLEARFLGGADAKLLDEGLLVGRQAEYRLEDKRDQDGVVRNGHGLMARTKPKPKPKPFGSCCEVSCKGTSCPQCAIVVDKPCAHGSCTSTACNHGLTIEEVMSLDARSWLPGDGGSEVNEREHAQKDRVEERKLAAEGDTTEA